MGESLALWPWSEARPVVSRRGAASFKEGGLSPLQLPLAPLRWGLLFTRTTPAAQRAQERHLCFPGTTEGHEERQPPSGLAHQ